MKIAISNEVKALCPGAALGILRYSADVKPAPGGLTELFDDAVRRLAGLYTAESAALDPHIAATRAAYKSLGKDPRDHRCAAEAMLRRIVKGTGLYRINNIVDVNNLISITSGYSIGSYDAMELRGGAVLRRAGDGESYEGIGKGRVNIGRYPALYDELGPFGNPSADSRRAMLREGPRRVLSVVYSFDGSEALRPCLDRFSALLEAFCSARDLESEIV